MSHTARHAAAEARRRGSALRAISFLLRLFHNTTALKTCPLLLVTICAIAADIPLPETATAETAMSASHTDQANAMLAKAEAAADKIKYHGPDSEVYLHIAMAYTDAGNIASAKRITNAIVGASQKASGYIHLAQWQASHNDIAGARESWAAAMTAVADMPEHLIDKASMYEDILKAQTNAGDVAGAQSTLDIFIKLNDTPDARQHPFFANLHREMILTMSVRIAKAQAKIGDTSAAIATLSTATTAATNHSNHTAGFIST